MTEEKAKPNPEVEELYVVEIKPGSSNEKGARILLPKQKVAECTLEDVVKDALKSETETYRRYERILERVGAQMKRDYGYTANDNPADRREKIKDLFEDATSPMGRPYKKLEIVVASEEQYGLCY
ncbi:MAG: hypothetical protein ABIB71_06205 [Candidatus Woesearchaeota archaeon]